MSDATPQNRHTPRVAQALVGAVERGDAQEVASLLASGGFADARTSAGETPLMRAAAKGFDDVARVLLDAGADPRARRPDGFTPLILAAFFGHEETVRLLLSRGADPLARTSLGTTAAAWAASRGFERIAEHIKEAEAAPPVLQKERERPPKADEMARGETTPVRVEVVHEVVEEIPARPPARRGAAVPFESFGASSSAGSPGNFFRSWQASIGAALLLTAFAVAAFAVWRTTKSGRGAGQQPVTAQTPLQQAVAPQPTIDPLAPTPSPTPDLQGYVGPQGPIIVYPGTGEPVLVSPAAPPPNAPGGVPALISESGATDESTTTRRQPTPTPTPRPAAQPTPTPPARPADERRGDPAPAQPEPQPRPTSPAATPPPGPTPERRKVIPWPPQ